MMRFGLVFCILLLSKFLFAQKITEDNWGSPERKFSEYSFRSKTVDSLSKTGNMIDFKGEDLYSFLNPAIDYFNGYSKDQIQQRIALGFDWHLQYKKWRIGATFMAEKGNYISYQNEFVKQKNVLPAMGIRRKGGLINANYKSAYINYKASDIFNFELGYGRDFFGQGHRSLFLSDFSNASPYFKIQTSFWNLQYTNLFAAHENIFNVEGAPELYQRKYTASHFLEWNVKDWFSIALFETVVWEGEQGNFHRAYDINYLNPVIFYRPVEFSTGSPDNVLVGGQLVFKPSKHHQIYTQLSFDEFLLAELKADVKQRLKPDEDIQSGWWANKYGIQLGWKANSLFNNPNFFARIEYNMVRPYTYAHSNPTQAYSNFNMSLAHPLGANFHELVSKLSYTKQRWRFNAQFNYNIQGISKAGTNYGEDIAYSTISREKEYGNYIGQGTEKQRLQYLNLSISYLVKKEWKARLTLAYIHRNEEMASAAMRDDIVVLRLRTNLFKQYFDF